MHVYLHVSCNMSLRSVSAFYIEEISIPVTDSSHHTPILSTILSPTLTYFGAYLCLAITRKPRNTRVDNLQRLLPLGRRRQILVPVLGDQDAVLDAHAAHVPVPVEHLGVDVLGVIGVGEEEGLDVGAVEVTSTSED